MLRRLDNRLMAAPHCACLIAGVFTTASVAGALLGYEIGHFFFDSFWQPVLKTMGKGEVSIKLVKLAYCAGLCPCV